MISGTITITGRAVVTHRRSYLLSLISLVSIQRPFMPTSLMLGGGLGAFALAFADLLYAHERAVLGGLVVLLLLVGWNVANLRLLSRDLRGTDLTTVVWGTYGHLNQIRHQIAEATERASEGGAK